MKKRIEAMNAYIGTKALLTNRDKKYIFEPKLDGFRALLYVNHDLEFISRNNLPLNERFPDLQGFRKSINAKSCVLDGEIIALDQQGTPRIALLGANPSHYVVFDILQKNGETLINKPLYERKKILDQTIKDGKHIQKSYVTTDGKELWNLMIQKNFEGVMAKEIDAKYYPGERKKVWLKIKNLNTADCVIVGYVSTGRRSLSSLLLALYDNQGHLHYIGNVGTGFSLSLIDELISKFEQYKTDKPTIAGITSKLPIVWLKPHFVGEVEFLEFTRDYRIRHSSFKRMRPDKKPRQCTLKANVPPITY